MEGKEDNELMYIYEWVDTVPLSRPKKNIARDFSDGVLMAEMIKYHLPKLVEIHNYPSASSTAQKNYNWSTLNNKVFKKLGFQINKKEIQDIISCKPNIIENLLKKVYKFIQKHSSGENVAGDRDNMSAENYNDENNQNENLNVNKSNPYSNEKQKIDYDNNQHIKNILDEKDMRIEELKNIIDILEMKLKNSADIQNALERRVKELTDIIREKGLK